MAARKKTKKSVTKKTTARTKKTVGKKTQRAHAYEEWSPSLVLGLVAVVMATLSVFGYHGRVALLAMVLGSITVWLSLREENYMHTLKGLTAIAIGVATIYGLALYTYDDIWFTYGYQGLL